MLKKFIIFVNIKEDGVLKRIDGFVKIYIRFIKKE